jgi:hypothetical protein
LLFLVYVFLGSSHAFVMIVKKSFECLDKTCILFRPSYMPILTGASAFLALLFGLFVVIMFCDQVGVIWSNTSTVDKLKKERNFGPDE